MPTFLQRVQAVCEASGLLCEIVLVDDGSRDATWHIIPQHARRDERILGVKLRRNHGHQLALSIRRWPVKANFASLPLDFSQRLYPLLT